MDAGGVDGSSDMGYGDRGNYDRIPMFFIREISRYFHHCFPVNFEFFFLLIFTEKNPVSILILLFFSLFYITIKTLAIYRL